MNQVDLLLVAATALESLAIRYFVTGSVATILYGEPRFTNDIDLAIDLDAARVEPLCRLFPADEYYVSPEAAFAAVARHGQFNVIHPRSGLKVDLMIVADTQFNRSRFERARRVTIAPGRNVAFTSPEDVILKKPEFYRQGGSDKHLRDVAGVLKVTGSGIDRRYIDEWAARLGLQDLWSDVSSRVLDT